MKRDATISPCGRYRYRLLRTWGPVPHRSDRVVFVMLNPSTADASVDDPTIRRCINFAKSWGYGGLVVVNLFAFRATNPRELLTASDPRGPANSAFLLDECDRRDVAAAWGASKIARGERAPNEYVRWRSNRVDCLGLTKTGAPRHPLYVRADTVRIPFEGVTS